MLRLFLGSWSSCLRMYSQSFLVSSVRGSGSFPTTAVSAASGCTGLLRAFLGAAAFLGVGIGQLERAGLGCQAKKSTVLPRSSRRYFQSQCHPRGRSRPPGVQQSVVVSIKSKAPRWVGWKSGGIIPRNFLWSKPLFANYRGSFNTLIFKRKQAVHRFLSRRQAWATRRTYKPTRGFELCCSALQLGPLCTRIFTV